MKKIDLPVLSIKNFNNFSHKRDFYVKELAAHIQEHKYVLVPHKHDFFCVAICLQGSGKHIIDFKTYQIKPGVIFFMSPGQAHSWTLSEDIDGYILFHTKEFFNLTFQAEKVEDYPFFSSINNSQLIELEDAVSLKKIETLFKEICEEFEGDHPMKFRKLSALVYVLYIDLLRIYEPQIQQSENRDPPLSKLREVETLIDTHFKTIKSAKEYAAMMHMSEKNLNRLSKTYFNKTISGLISDRVILEAKRMLVHAEHSISEIASELGYLDNSYFARFFRKRSGESPKTFIKNNR